MRYTEKDDTFVSIKESGCNLNYVPKDNMNIHVTEDNIDFVEGFINKLGKLEDIEDELGIDLITLFNALKNGIWLKNKDKSIEHKFVVLRCYTDKFYLIYNEGCNDFSYYGKTWALTKKELEGDKK